MRGGSRVLLAVVVVGAIGADAPAARRPPPCAGGRYVVHDEPLIAGVATPLPDAVAIGDFQVAIGSGCAARPVNVRATWRGTRFRRRWAHCEGVPGAVVVSAVIEPTCQVMIGRLVARRAHVRRNFVATLTRCGDGVVDGGEDEQCESAAGCAATEGCTGCRCVPFEPSTTTSSVTTTSVTSSTATTSTTSTVTSTTSTSDTSTTSTSSSTTSTSTTTTMPLPDLVPTALSAPASAATEAPVSVSWTIENQGTAAAKPSWGDTVYLSADGVVDGTDVPVGTVPQAAPLAVGGSYTRTQTMTIPNVPAGPWFLLVQTDAADTVVELSSANNTRAVPITIQTPNLVPTAFAAPSVASADTAVSVSWTIANTGTGDARPTWSEAIFLSTDATLDGADQQLATSQRTTAVAAGGSYERSLTVTLPKVPAGAYVLILRADNANGVYEEREDDNTRTTPIAIQTPDLVPTAFSAPPSAAKGAGISVSWTITNQGTAAARPSWVDAVVLSSDAVVSGTDPQLGSAQRATLLAAGASYDVTQTMSIPNVAPGDYFLIVRTNKSGSVYEEDPTNDTRVLPITITP